MSKPLKRSLSAVVYLYRCPHHVKMASKKGKTELDEHYWKLVRRVAQNILQLRESKQLTQEDMLALGFERRWYQRIESGTYSVSLPTLDRLARAFKVDVSVFFKKP